MTSTKKLLALIGMSLIAFVAFLEYTVVSTALPTIQQAFSVSMLDLQWVFNIYSIVAAISMILAGRLGDLFGRRKVFYIGALLLGVGSLGAGFSPTYYWLIFFRAVQSLGVAATVTLASSLINIIYGDKAHYPMSFFVAFTGLGLAVGPYLGGVLVTAFGWEWIFFINIPLLIIAYIFCIPCVPESKASKRVALDLKGAVLFALTIVSLILGLVEGEQIGWAQPFPLLCIVVFLIALPLLVKVENACKNPIIDFSFFAKKDFFLAGLVCVLGGGLISPALLFAPMYLQKVIDFSPEKAGLYLLMVPISVVIFAPLVGAK
jgi:EmrB/QacA subfamily drug resistance transporter